EQGGHADAIVPRLQRLENRRHRSDGVETAAFPATADRSPRIDGRMPDFARSAVSARDELMVRDQSGADTAVKLHGDRGCTTSGRTPDVLAESREIRVVLDQGRKAQDTAEISRGRIAPAREDV